MPKASSIMSVLRAPSLLMRLYKRTNPGHVFVRLCTAILFSFSFFFLEQQLANPLPKNLYLRSTPET